MISRSMFNRCMAAAALTMLTAGIAAAQTTVVVDSVAISPSGDLTIDNDFTRLNSAFAGVVDDDTTIELNGTFDITETNAAAAYAANSYQFTMPPPAHANTVITGVTDAEIVVDIYDNGSVPAVYFFLINAHYPNGLTVENVTFRGGFTQVFRNNGRTLTDFIVQNNTAYLGTYMHSAAYFFVGSPSFTANNLLIDSNTVYLAVNAGQDGIGAGYQGTSYGIVFGCCQSNNFNLLTITNNEFLAWADPSLPGATPPYMQTSRIWGIYDNNNTNRGPSNGGSEMYMNNNLFDMGLPDGNGGTVMFYSVGILPTGVDGYIDGNLTGVYEINGNTFRNMARALWPVWFNAGDANDGMLLLGNTFENCGFLNGGAPINSTYDTLRYIATIQNATAGGFGTSGGTRAVIDLATDVNGVTGIPMLNSVALDPLFFEMEPADDTYTVFSQTGILAGEVYDVPATVYNRTVDDAWTFADKWTYPDPAEADGPTDLTGEELAIGYNAFGNAIDPGDPDEISNTPGDPLVIDISVDTQYAPTTVIDKDVTIRLDPNKFGSPDGAPVVSPTVKSLTDPLFVVQSGGKLTLQNLTISGDSPFPGIRDIQSLVKVESGGELVVENCTLINSFAGAIDAADVDVTVTGTWFGNANPAVRVSSANNLSVSDSAFGSLATGVINLGPSNIALEGNVHLNTGTDVFFIQQPATLSITRSLFFSTFQPYFNAAVYPDGGVFNLTFENNWHNQFYGEAANENNGYIVGTLNAIRDLSFPFDFRELVAGVLTYDSRDSAAYDNRGFVEVNISSQFDRTLNALPEIWALTGTTDYTLFDSDGDGWPDGVEVAMGTDPDDENDFPAGTFEINEDSNTSGFADWYEMALKANTGVDPFLGDVLRTGGVTLQDAVRALQLVNGAFGQKDHPMDGDLNALNVTGLGVSSLGNPLQILRYQAGVRNKLPALAGID